MNLKTIGEFGLIERLKAGAVVVPDKVIMGIGDDAAVLKGERGYLTLASTDMLVEDIHFTLATATAREIGYKTMAVNVSDIAAMGGIPEQALISLGLRPEQPVEFVDELYAGLRECGQRFGVNIIGGDTVSSPRAMVINLAILGRVEEGACLYRSGARPGDVLLVTGDLGGSAAGLDTLLSPRPAPTEAVAFARERHFRPTPRVAEIRAALPAGGITAADDISDGLVAEIYTLAQASGVGITLEAAAVPIAPATRQLAAIYQKDPLDYALYGGEDFELLLTCRPDKVAAVQKAIAEACQTPVTPIGNVVPAAEGITIIIEGKRLPLNPGGYNHFR
ncbi:MAG: thiamine-monophosphate kinase [Moorella sp. (in: firmicutes)]|jgi:thiamine-monophosphate kinase|uniref:thiamine-phosphate kinase n=1 Tax=unclassified Neomoorella TaxID=2676739 RepID=UPI0010FFB58E|nr:MULTISPECIES: thiamine-phosphate kinase [unclassified Moorella (in: firmicutes)]MDK2817785.1 thiamine-monophosphate kinase [Moorella sp. (in: firmicutes)]MDK2894574.1 thiamine-monophosphate kinase [Moorella sp. (in: firmicutes)]GEA15364.1 thiamine-monophosphate kinase [Moorella sp. E308F]GEA19775.1 thiamine-monophosphate kinase [Moorella sp. E306M]